MRLDHKGSQFLEPLFEYSGACAGCGETPYLKLLTQLFGDRYSLQTPPDALRSMVATFLRRPTQPIATAGDRHGPTPYLKTTPNSDSVSASRSMLISHAVSVLVQQLAPSIGETLASELLEADQESEAGIVAQRERVEVLRSKLAGLAITGGATARNPADYLVKKSVWLVGGDGWAYDIGYGGLDHVLANRRDVNVLVLDTEVYSNTGGQQSKATPLGAAAKFAASGKSVGKKDLGLLANMYGHVYVARVAFGAKMLQTVQAFREAEAYQGPSLIIAYSHCIAHGYDMAQGAAQQKLAVESGVWPLYRFDPRRIANGEPPLNLDYGPPKARVADYMRNESRFRMIERADPARFKGFLEDAQAAAERRYLVYQQLAGIKVPAFETKGWKRRPRWGGGQMNLSTTYLGIPLP